MILDMIKARDPKRETRERSHSTASHVSTCGIGRSWTKRYTPSALDRVISPSADWPVLAVGLGMILTFTIVLVLGHWPGLAGSRGPIALLLFLVPVVLAATLGGWWSGVSTTVLAVVVWDWFFLLPTRSLGRVRVDDIVTLAVYFSVTALVAWLTSAMRQRARVASQQGTELAAVLDVTSAVASTLDMPTVLGQVLEQVQRVIECASAAVILHDGDQLSIAGYRGPTATEQVVGHSLPLGEATVYPVLVRRRAPLIVADLQGGSAMAALSGASRYARRPAGTLVALGATRGEGAGNRSSQS